MKAFWFSYCLFMLLGLVTDGLWSVAFFAFATITSLAGLWQSMTKFERLLR